MFYIQVIGIKFTSRNQYGDFYWMCMQNKYENSLFIFNDNEEYHNTCKKGLGNAIIRIFNKYSKLNKPMSAGIPTGTLILGGYDKFTPKVKKTIDNAFEEIIELIKIHNYDTIYFSSELDGKLGTSIFNVNPKVIMYITSRIYKLSFNHIQIVKSLQNDNFDNEFDFENEFNFENDNTNNDTNILPIT